MANHNGHPLTNVCANRGGPSTTLTAGVTLNAVEALTSRDQQHFTRAQVAYLMHLAYESGRAHAAAEDMAEVVACWHEYAEARPTREQRVQQRLAEMEAGAEREARRPRTKPSLDCDWPNVAPLGGPSLRAVA